MSTTSVQLTLDESLITCMLKLESLRILKGFANSAKPTAKSGTYDEALLALAKGQKQLQLANTVKSIAADVALDKSMPQVKLLLPAIGNSLTPLADIVRVTKAPAFKPTQQMFMQTAPGEPPVW
ncbi:MAG: hypothetical protein ACRC3B_22825, partial [Bacteroidia bacterium]